MAHSNFQDLGIYQPSEILADRIWEIVPGWSSFHPYGRQCRIEHCRGSRPRKLQGQSPLRSYLARLTVRSSTLARSCLSPQTVDLEGGGRVKRDYGKSAPPT